LSGIIPAYSPAPNPSQDPAGVDLLSVTIKPSIMLWRIETLVYLVALGLATIALIPFFATAFYWSLLWLVVAGGMLGVMRKSWKAKNQLAVSVSLQNSRWRLRIASDDYLVAPCGDIVLWGHLVLLPLQETASGRRHFIIALEDSMTAEEWRRLRVWLKTRLHKQPSADIQ